MGSVPPKLDGLRMRKGWLTTGDSGEGEAGTGLAEMQPGLGPGTKLQPVDRTGHRALAMAEWSYRCSGLPQASELRSSLVVGGGQRPLRNPSPMSFFPRSKLGLKKSTH